MTTSHGFTTKARAAITGADVQARDHGSQEVRCEHLLLSLLGGGSSAALLILRKCGVNIIELRGNLIASPAASTSAQRVGTLPRARSANKSIELAMAQAHSEVGWGKDFTIGTQHLLIGLVWEGQGAAARALTGAGVTVDRIKAAIAELGDSLNELGAA